MRRDVFQAIADPTRRSIIFLLAVQSMTPNAIAGHFDQSRQAVSKHLQILADCEVVSARKQGREQYYYLNQQKLNEVEKWMQHFKALLEQRFTQLARA